MKKEAFNRDFWLNLGFSYNHIGEYEAAIKAYAHGIKLAPEKADGYLSCASAYVCIEDFEQAQRTCDIGIRYAEAHMKEPWAKKLKKMLQEGRSHIDELYTKSKYGTFAS